MSVPSEDTRERAEVELVPAAELQEGDRVWDDNGHFRTITGFGRWVEGSGRENWINAQLDDPILKMWLDAPRDERVLRVAVVSPSPVDAERPERWMVDYEHGEGEPQHAVLSWLDDEAKDLPEVGTYLVRESDVLRAAASRVGVNGKNRFVVRRTEDGLQCNFEDAPSPSSAAPGVTEARFDDMVIAMEDAAHKLLGSPEDHSSHFYETMLRAALAVSPSLSCQQEWVLDPSPPCESCGAAIRVTGQVPETTVRVSAPTTEGRVFRIGVNSQSGDLSVTQIEGPPFALSFTEDDRPIVPESVIAVELVSPAPTEGPNCPECSTPLLPIREGDSERKWLCVRCRRAFAPTEGPDDA